MDDLDKLQKLAFDEQSYGTGTNPTSQKLRYQYLTAIYNLVNNDTRLRICQQSLGNQYRQILGGEQLFQECYREALAKTWLEFLVKYDCKQRSIWEWFKERLTYRFIDTKNEYLNLRKSHQKVYVNVSLDKPVYDHNQDSEDRHNIYLDVLQMTKNKQDERREFAEHLMEIIQKDKYHIFKCKYLENCPHSNYQFIALARYEEKSWAEIAAELRQKVGSITPFFTRSNNYFRPILYELVRGEFNLSPDLETKIIENCEQKFEDKKFIIKEQFLAKAILPISFRSILIEKLHHRGLAWENLSDKLGFSQLTQELIYFYLDTIYCYKSHFKNEFYL